MISIGRAAKTSELPVKTIRYYDEIHLVTPSDHGANGYRLYNERDLRKLIFVRQARAFGFSIDACRELLDLFENPRRTSKEVKEITSRRLKEIRQKMKELKCLYNELTHLASTCHGDERPDCPIIDFLGENKILSRVE